MYFGDSQILFSVLYFIKSYCGLGLYELPLFVGWFPLDLAAEVCLVFFLNISIFSFCY